MTEFFASSDKWHEIKFAVVALDLLGNFRIRFIISSQVGSIL